MSEQNCFQALLCLALPEKKEKYSCWLFNAVAMSLEALLLAIHFDLHTMPIEIVRYLMFGSL